MHNARIEYLLNQFFCNQCTDTEKSELAIYIENNSNDNELRMVLEQIWANYNHPSSMPDEVSQRIMQNIFIEDDK